MITFTSNNHMQSSRLIRLLISVIASVVLMAILVMATPEENPNRILVMLGGTMPEGLIQGATYFLFIFALLEVMSIKSKLTIEQDAFTAHLLPEKENYVLSADDANQLKLNMQHLEHQRNYYLVDLIKKACTKYRLSKSSSEVLSLTDAQIKLYNAEVESEQSYINYAIWAIPSVGFIGTVLGIAASLGFANQASTPEGIEKVTSMLAVAFDTTLVALVLSVILMYLVHSMHKQQDELFTKMNSYIIENLINRFYK